MGEVLNFRGADGPGLFDALREALKEEGHVDTAIADLSVAVDTWRKTARAAARSLGRPVQTLEGVNTVHAILKDWPANPEEEAKVQARMRAAMNAMSKAFTADDRTSPR